jgi:DNA-binding NtrC family response regulator
MSIRPATMHHIERSSESSSVPSALAPEWETSDTSAPRRAAVPLLLGNCEAIEALRERLRATARARRTTLVTGPTGVGKEVVASALHQVAHGGSEAPYVAVHCGALPEQLAEAELFGHTRGAFTGAVQARAGLVRAAAGGTLFLDEVDSLSPSVQVKLLRFLETGELRAVGSDRSQHADVWVIAATNGDLRARVRSGAFREDLLYRLEFLHLEVPALKERGGDIELLAKHFLLSAGGEQRTFSPRALDAIYAHDWPGNVRELRHRVERAALMATGDRIEPEDLGLATALLATLSTHPPSSTAPDAVQDLWQLIERDGLSLAQALERCERILIEAALAAAQDNRTRAAQRLGIHVRTIFKKLSR